MELAEYALMDAAEDRMWWYRALHRRLLDHWRMFMAACWTRAAAPAACCASAGAAAGPAGDRCGMGRHGVPPRRRQVRRADHPWQRQCVAVRRGGFDAAVAADLLCHRAVDPAMALAELRRVLRPGGRLIVNMPAYAWLLSVHDRLVHNVRRCTARQLAAMLREAGFVRVRARYWNCLLLPLMVVQRKLLASAHEPPTLPRFRHGSMPCFMPSQRSSVACSSACRPAVRCWRPRSGHERRHRPALPSAR